jgi:hypothetical protein
LSKSKQQGTAFESWVVNWLRSFGQMNPRRIAEGGSKDEGDVTFDTHFDGRWIIECKATQTLNVTRVLGKARVKSPNPKQTILMWKRLTKSEGNKRRTPDGESIVVVMGLDTFEYLLGHPDD